MEITFANAAVAISWLLPLRHPARKRSRTLSDHTLKRVQICQRRTVERKHLMGAAHETRHSFTKAQLQRFPRSGRN